jgi:hypothetical protein
LPLVVEAGGNATVKDLADNLASSDRAIFNLSRELRLLGVTAYEPNRVRLIDEVLNAEDREQEMRRRVGAALRRHRAYSALRKLAERSGRQVTLDSYSRELPNAFPAVEVASTAWQSYARAFLFWIEYAGLVVRHGAEYRPTVEPTATPTVRLLDAPSPLKYRPSVPHRSPGRALKLLARLHTENEIELPSVSKDREAAGTLFAMPTVSETSQMRRCVQIASKTRKTRVGSEWPAGRIAFVYGGFSSRGDCPDRRFSKPLPLPHRRTSPGVWRPPCPLITAAARYGR